MQGRGNNISAFWKRDSWKVLVRYQSRGYEKWIWWAAGGLLGVLTILLLWAATPPFRGQKRVKLTPQRQKSTYAANFRADTLFSYIKDVPPAYETLFCIVSQGYPELAEVDISLEFAKIKTTMQAQPNLARKGGKRKYRIVINNDPDFEGIHFEDIPFNAQIGIIAHECAHILDYEQKSLRELAATGLRYASKSGKARYEKSIDSLTVRKGFGYQLKDWAQYAMYDSKATPAYKAFKKHFYLRPTQIDSLLLHLD